MDAIQHETVSCHGHRGKVTGRRQIWQRIAGPQGNGEPAQTGDVY